MTDANRLLYPYDEIRALLGGIGRTSLFGLIDAKDLQRVKIGRRAFVTADSLRAYVERLGSVTAEATTSALAGDPTDTFVPAEAAA
jgi:hypothetical protein